MVAVFPAWITMTVLLLEVALVMGGFLPATLRLERRIPLGSHEFELSRLRERDSLRHGRLLQSSGGVVEFSVQGTYDPSLVGLYYSKLQLGSPPREFYVQIDTGSNVLWIGCNSCNGCPESSGLQIPLNLYDPGSSSTASFVSCSDQRCSAGLESLDSSCSGQSNRCSYTFQYGDGSGTSGQYGDGSGTSGYYVADLLHFNSILEGSVTTNSTVTIMFGCSVLQTGVLMNSDTAVDGIFGLGQQSLSVISQLSSLGITPRVFSHCLKGNNGGGGILVFGEVLEPNMVYTPLVPSQLGGESMTKTNCTLSQSLLYLQQFVVSCLLLPFLLDFQRPHYNLDLRSISVGGQVLSIDPSVFSTSSNQGTIVDSGTTLAYLADEAYDALISAITNTVSQTVRPVLSKGFQCYQITSSISDIFPQVGLNFAGGASMILNPQDYLLLQNYIDTAAVWCIGFHKIQGQRITILGDLVLKDKIIVYDLANQRIGWTNYDCSMPFNVSANLNTARTEFVNAGQMSNDGSSWDRARGMTALLLHIIMLAGLLFL